MKKIITISLLISLALILAFPIAAQTSGALTLEKLEKAAKDASFVTDKNMAFHADFDGKPVPEPVDGFCVEVTYNSVFDGPNSKIFGIYVNEFASIKEAQDYAKFVTKQDKENGSGGVIHTFDKFCAQFTTDYTMPYEKKLMDAFTKAGWGEKSVAPAPAKAPAVPMK